jgi:hypothetical protein
LPTQESGRSRSRVASLVGVGGCGWIRARRRFARPSSRSTRADRGHRSRAFVDRALDRAFASPLCFNDLDAFADGTTPIPFGVAITPFVPCGTATLVGASITNGRIERATPFTLLFPRGTFAFGLDFATTGSDVAYASMFVGLGPVGTITRDRRYEQPVPRRRPV